ncbi:thioredoxin family protein [Bacteroidota bacterium]
MKLYSENSTNHKPALVEVQAKWSGESHLMELIINKIEEEFQNQVEVIRIDFEANRELLILFGIECAPAVLFISRGQIVEVIKKTLSRKKLKQLVRDFIIRNNTSTETKIPVITEIIK